MRYNQYRFKFYLNASHFIYMDGVSGQNHPHTWEFTLNTLKIADGFIQFNDVEKFVENLLAPFQNINLNDREPFHIVNPTLENICEYFKEEIQQLLMNNGWLLTTIEISETPARSYVIDLIDEYDLDEIRNMSFDTEDEIVDKMAQEKLDEILKETLS